MILNYYEPKESKGTGKYLDGIADSLTNDNYSAYSVWIYTNTLSSTWSEMPWLSAGLLGVAALLLAFRIEKQQDNMRGKIGFNMTCCENMMKIYLKPLSSIVDMSA